MEAAQDLLLWRFWEAMLWQCCLTLQGTHPAASKAVFWEGKEAKATKGNKSCSASLAYPGRCFWGWEGEERG